MAGFGSPAQIGAADLANMLTTGRRIITVVVVNFVSIVAIGHGLMKNFWPMQCREFPLFETIQTRLLH